MELLDGKGLHKVYDTRGVLTRALDGGSQACTTGPDDDDIVLDGLNL